MSTLDTLAPGGIVQLNDVPAPLDDATFDSLFPMDGAPAAPQVQIQKTETQQSNPAPVVTTPASSQDPAQPFIKGDKSVYNTLEATVEGINQKDNLIGTLRERYILATGLDPITGQPVGIAPPVVNDNYTSNPKQYMEDLYKATTVTDPQAQAQAYARVQNKFIMDSLAPLAPMIQQVTKQKAVETASAKNPEVGTFVQGPQFNKALEAFPDLKNAIQLAEDPKSGFSDRLPQYYEIAYMVSKGMQLPELLQANATKTPVTQTQPPRTTMPSSTPAPATERAQKPSFNTHAGIKSFIADAEAKGMSLITGW